MEKEGELMKALEHFRTITNHKTLVMHYCFRAGLYWQGICHDLSKYGPTEFLVGAKYFQGHRSPNNAEREVKGYSSAWLHHKGRNKHHLEYWIDYSSDRSKVFEGMEMPVRFVVEMFFDRIAACRTYQKEAYTQESPWIYYEKSKAFHVMHPVSQRVLERLLRVLAEDGEETAISYAKWLLRNDRCKRLRAAMRGQKSQ